MTSRILIAYAHEPTTMVSAHAAEALLHSGQSYPR